jgi:hypothetical protein
MREGVDQLAPAPVGREVHAKVYAAHVEIWNRGKCIAQHERCFSRQQKVLNLEHYLDALSKKRPRQVQVGMRMEW